MSTAGTAGSRGPIRIVIADDHAIVRRGLRQLLDSEDGFEVVAEGEDVESARRYLRGHRPEVLVLDLNMPGEPSLEAIPKLRAEFPDTQIVVLTMNNEAAYARTALGAGVVRTVETHRARIQQKLDLSDRSELVRYALDKGLVS